MRVVVVFAVLAGLLYAGWAAAAPAVQVDAGRFVDAQGRQVLLRGVNVGDKSAKRGYIADLSPEDFARLRAWGMNCLRFMIFWDGVEPEPGVYDDAYLGRVAEQVQWAADAGLWVILDMHQDLYGPAIRGGDGAPAWATLTDGLPHGHIPGAWASAYTCSPRLQRAFDHFYGNTPGPDGIGLRDRFAAAWRHVAERFKTNPAVIGYDLLNEPAMGERIRHVSVDVWRASVGIIGPLPKPPGGLAGFSGALSSGVPPRWLLDAFADRARYERFLEVFEPHAAAFEKEQLEPLYQCVGAAIREADREGILFIAPEGIANFGVRTHLAPVRSADGAPDPQQAFFPHVYDLVTDTPLAHEASAVRFAVIFDRIETWAERHGMPVAVGEWGAYYNSPKAGPTARRVVREFEAHGYGDFYWSYSRRLADAAYLDSLRRPYPMRVAGVLDAYSTDPETRVFSCAWTDAACAAPTEIYLPAAWYPGGWEIEIEPAGAAYDFEALAEDGSGLLRVPALEPGSRRTVVARPRRNDGLYTAHLSR